MLKITAIQALPSAYPFIVRQLIIIVLLCMYIHTSKYIIEKHSVISVRFHTKTHLTILLYIHVFTYSHCETKQTFISINFHTGNKQKKWNMKSYFNITAIIIIFSGVITTFRSWKLLWIFMYSYIFSIIPSGFSWKCNILAAFRFIT